MAYKLADRDYLELWRYFEDRADNVKEAMFNSVTWSVGFAAAILGFIFASLIDLEATALTLKHPWLVLGISAAGVVLCGYALILVAESKRHILANWERASRCEGNVEGLAQIWQVKGKAPLMEVWSRIAAVIYLMGAAFVGISLWAAFEAFCRCTI